MIRLVRGGVTIELWGNYDYYNKGYGYHHNYYNGGYNKLAVFMKFTAVSKIP